MRRQLTRHIVSTRFFGTCHERHTMVLKTSDHERLNPELRRLTIHVEEHIKCISRRNVMQSPFLSNPHPRPGCSITLGYSYSICLHINEKVLSRNCRDHSKIQNISERWPILIRLNITDTEHVVPRFWIAAIQLSSTILFWQTEVVQCRPKVPGLNFLPLSSQCHRPGRDWTT
jgi:hypothetical protein